MKQRSLTPQNFMHIYWVGGSPCAGKTSVSQLLAEQLGLAYVKLDDYVGELEYFARHDEQPISYIMNQLPTEARMLALVELSGLEEILRLEELFTFAIRELAALPTKPTIVESCALLPSLVDPYLADATKAIRLTPTAEFQSSKYLKRGKWVHDILSTAIDPKVTFERWMAREQAIAQHVINDAKERAFQYHIVDGSLSIACTADLIARRFGLITETVDSHQIPGNFLSLPGIYSSIVPT